MSIEIWGLRMAHSHPLSCQAAIREHAIRLGDFILSSRYTLVFEVPLKPLDDISTTMCGSFG